MPDCGTGGSKVCWEFKVGACSPSFTLIAVQEEACISGGSVRGRCGGYGGRRRKRRQRSFKQQVTRDGLDRVHASCPYPLASLSVQGSREWAGLGKLHGGPARLAFSQHWLALR